MPIIEKPDLIFHSGRVFTHPWSTSRSAAVAVKNGRIVAIGNNEDILALKGPRTKLVDIHGQLLVPGFQDVHVHPVTAGEVLSSCYLLDTFGREETLNVIREYTASHSSSPWVRGWGWKQDDFGPSGPSRDVLDRIIPDRPAYLTRADGHAAWVNSKALEIAGVADDAPDPQGGRYERDSEGRITGLLHERAMNVVQRVFPKYTTRELLDALKAGQNHLLSLGITGWQDASVEEEQLRAYTAGEASGELAAHVTGALRWDADKGLDQISDIIERRRIYANDHLTLNTVKIMIDGVIEGSHTAALEEPYLDPDSGKPTDNYGKTFLDADELKDAVNALTSHGFQLHFHAIGDRAVHYALDALEYAFVRNGAPGNHPVISHIQLINPKDVERFEQLGAIGSMQPFWASRDATQEALTIPYIGLERAAREYPFHDLAEAGVTLAGGSDWMISSAWPIDGIHVAVNRKQYDLERSGRSFLHANPEPLYPHNAITLAQGLTAYTYGTATANNRQHITGRLFPGYRADFALLDRDPFAAPDDQIGATKLVATYISGKPVYEA